MDDDGLSVFDRERVIFTGEIIERQRDKRTFEDKYLVAGQTLSGGNACAVAKFGPTEKLVIIAVYLG